MPNNPDTNGNGIIDSLDASWLLAFVDGLPRDHFARPWHRPLMKLRIRAAEALAVRLDAGELALALLDSLDTHVDGCGTEPDRDDWIVDCASQSGFRELLSLYKRGVSTLVLSDDR